jgi:hypothetical protein
MFREGFPARNRKNARKLVRKPRTRTKSGNHPETRSSNCRHQRDCTTISAGNAGEANASDATNPKSVPGEEDLEDFTRSSVFVPKFVRKEKNINVVLLVVVLLVYYHHYMVVLH